MEKNKEQDAIEKLDALLDSLKNSENTLNILNELNDLKARLIQLELIVYNLQNNKYQTITSTGTSTTGTTNINYGYEGILTPRTYL